VACRNSAPSQIKGVQNHLVKHLSSKGEHVKPMTCPDSPVGVSRCDGAFWKLMNGRRSFLGSMTRISGLQTARWVKPWQINIPCDVLAADR
jgi:hypothetical protein